VGLATASALHGPPAIKGVGVKKVKKKKIKNNSGWPHNACFFANASLAEVEEIPCITRYLLRNFSPSKRPSTTTSSLKVNKQTNRKKIFQACPEHNAQEMRQFCIWITLPETKQIKI